MASAASVSVIRVVFQWHTERGAAPPPAPRRANARAAAGHGTSRRLVCLIPLIGGDGTADVRGVDVTFTHLIALRRASLPQAGRGRGVVPPTSGGVDVVFINLIAMRNYAAVVALGCALLWLRLEGHALLREGRTEADGGVPSVGPRRSAEIVDVHHARPRQGSAMIVHEIECR